MYLHLDILVILWYAELFFLIGRSFRQEYQFRIYFFFLRHNIWLCRKWQIQMGTKSKGVDISLLQVWTTHHSFFTLDHMLNNWPVYSTCRSNLLNLSSYTCISSWNIKVPFNPHGTWPLNFHISFHLDKWYLCMYVFLICIHNIGLGGS